ncbi:hypothetical protein ACH34C_07145 [Elizabethkingia anophelis]|uniref:hypothetical protein n=1 Tax=Elizabethkingia anophelis TaxID=1117645 RepID=UPI003786FCAE
MDATELRIGNLITRQDIGNGYARIETILELRRDSVFTSGPINVTCNYDDISPIPLTYDWLIKFGFTNDENYFNIGNLHYNLETKKIYIGNDHVSSGHDDTELIYVHQLQNIYFTIKREELIFKY